MWEQAGDAAVPQSIPYKCVYAIHGSWNAFVGEAMFRSTEPGTWEFDIKIGMSGKEEFQFSKDFDTAQLIYPAVDKAKSSAIPVRGPDDFGNGKFWIVQGRGEEVLVTLKLVDAQVIVSILTETQGKRQFESISGWDRHDYFVNGSLTGGHSVPMIMDPADPGIFKTIVKIPQHLINTASRRTCRFQVRVDDDPKTVFYPEEEADSGTMMVYGPDSNHQGKVFYAKGFSTGMACHIELNLATMDRREVVRWMWLPLDSNPWGDPELQDGS